MANRHFGKLADVWKHGVLVEVLGRETPSRYAETHAGSAAYPMVMDDERRFGVLRFLAKASEYPVLAGSRYRAALGPFVDGEPMVYPGSARLAMSALDDDCSYLLCDVDPASAADLAAHERRVDLQPGESTLRAGESTVRAVVHIDPVDPHAHTPAGHSALTLAARIAEFGHQLIYWYGYDRPERRGWAHQALTELTTAPALVRWHPGRRRRRRRPRR